VKKQPLLKLDRKDEIMLKEKYQPVLDLAATLGVKLASVAEEGGKLTVKGASPYQLEKNLVWDKIKTMSGWENELAVDLAVEKTDILGVYAVQSGDSLSKIAKKHLGSADKYMVIFNANTDILKNPDLIKVGQKLKIPNP
jgi:LysM repeat protein